MSKTQLKKGASVMSNNSEKHGMSLKVKTKAKTEVKIVGRQFHNDWITHSGKFSFLICV